MFLILGLMISCAVFNVASFVSLTVDEAGVEVDEDDDDIFWSFSEDDCVVGEFGVVVARIVVGCSVVVVVVEVIGVVVVVAVVVVVVVVVVVRKTQVLSASLT